jgi:eukaryotic-like serine/threonine-protein kinase
VSEPSATVPAPPGGGAPQSYGPYLLLEKIGSGGMAEVFRAIRKGPEGFVRLFALKRIIPRHAESREFVQMFINEARLSALLNHPNLVQVYDFGEVEGSYYLAMEFLKGRTVLSVMRSLHARRMPFPAPAIGYIGRQVALGLAYAHSLRGEDGKTLGLVHRDINPSNVMLLKSGGVKVLDFGIAKAPSLAEHQTQAGLVKGKLSYAAPEQLKCLPLTGKADVFSLGVTLWEMLTMQKLFGGSTDFDTVNNVMTKQLKPPSAIRADVPPVLDRLVMQALERDIDRRPDARQLAHGLGDYLREARFLDDSVVELLRELFGEHTSRVVTLVPGMGLTSGPTTFPAASPTPAGSQGSGSTLSAAPAGEEGTAKRKGAKAPSRGGWPIVALGVAGLGVLVAASWGSLRNLGGTPQRQTAPGSGAAASDPLLTARVTVEIDSRPAGAAVEDSSGAVVGETPVTLKLPRAQTPTSFVVKKAGFQPLRYEVIPDRDTMVTLVLRP